MERAWYGLGAFGLERFELQPHPTPLAAQRCNLDTPNIIPLSPRTHYTRACGHQLTSPPCRVRGPLQFSSGSPPLTWHSKGPSPGSLTPNTHRDICINGVQNCCDDESFFQVPSDTPISLRRPHRTSVRVLISVAGMD